MSTRMRGTAGAMAVVVILIGAWLSFGPRQLGGPVSYVVVEGSSMEPLLHAGDLAGVREQASYGPGNVVAFESRQLGRVVMHRIVDIEQGVLVTKGDNNAWLDPERPVEAAVLGTLDWHVPRVGGLIVAVREPRTAALTVAALTVLALGPGLRRPSPAGDGPSSGHRGRAPAGSTAAGD